MDEKEKRKLLEIRIWAVRLANYLEGPYITKRKVRKAQEAYGQIYDRISILIDLLNGEKHVIKPKPSRKAPR